MVCNGMVWVAHFLPYNIMIRDDSPPLLRVYSFQFASDFI